MDELATGVARMGLSRHMAALFRKAAAYANTRKESIVRQQASIAAHCLNSYVNWLGFDPLTRTESERSIVVQTLEGSVNVSLFRSGGRSIKCSSSVSVVWAGMP